MTALKTIKQRRSIRNYKDEPIEDKLIEELIDCARLAATARNVQPWIFVVVKNQEVRQQLAEISDYGKFIAQAPVCIVVFCEDTKYYLEDGSAATENILLAATALGLGSCWVAGDKKTYARKIAELLAVPNNYKLVSMVTIGKPEGEIPSPPKKKLAEVIYWEKYKDK